MSFGQHQSLTQRQELTQEQHMLLQHLTLTLRLNLISVLNDEHYEPKAECPKCFRKLTPAEIIQGFNKDPNDFTTRCSGCGTRFEPILVCSSQVSSVEIPFFCDVQTLAQLDGKGGLPPKQFLKEYPAIYRSAIVHYGNLGKAFARAGLTYEFKDIATDWKNKIEPFLGRLPDTIIADCTDVSVSTIRNMRQRLGISRHTAKKMLNEID